jgi:hypothetical protein
MGKGDAKPKFDVGNPEQQVENYLNEFSKYKLGEEGLTFFQIKKMKPVFAFDYVSMDNGDLCFNRPTLSTDDYIGLIQGLKKISEHTYEVLHNTKAFRFHKVDFDDKRVSISRRDFKLKLTHKEELLRDEELPNLWQFDLQYVGGARAAGFLYKGIFYLVWYDRDHQIYPSTK